MVEVKYADFLEMIDQKAIDSVNIDGGTIYIVLKKKDGTAYRGKTFYTGLIESDTKLVERLEKADIDGKRRGETFSMEEYARLADAWYDKIHE